MAMWEGEMPGEEPQKTHIFVGGGEADEELVVWAKGEEMDGLVDSRREGTGEAAERGEAPPDAILFCGYEFEKCG